MYFVILVTPMGRLTWGVIQLCCQKWNHTTKVIAMARRPSRVSMCLSTFVFDMMVLLYISFFNNFILLYYITINLNIYKIHFTLGMNLRYIQTTQCVYFGRTNNKQNINWSDVEKYLEQYVGEIFTIAENGENFYTI